MNLFVHQENPSADQCPSKSHFNSNKVKRKPLKSKIAPQGQEDQKDDNQSAWIVYFEKIKQKTIGLRNNLFVISM